MRTSSVLLVVLLAGACATTTVDRTVFRWSKAYTTQDAYLRDRSACILEAREQRPQAGNEAVSKDIFLPCMTARGYRLDPAGEFGPPASGAVELR
jgi:hypothetical protein